ncbi:MAG: GNAT family N-acetyltransferase [Shinella sp.]|nr:GNAT family N-acetyltransferase [Shinella sp.]
MLADGYTDVPAGKLAAVVTSLEMRAPAKTAHGPDRPDLVLKRMESPDPDWYRDLYRRVGTDWLWVSRLAMPDDKLRSILNDPLVEVWAVMKDGRSEGLLELDCREEGECELAFFGLAASIIGQGAGRWLMNRAIERAWSKPISRFWVHTCTIDSPQALGFYIRSGFVPYKRQIEIFDDPRLLGLLPKEAAPQVPVL